MLRVSCGYFDGRKYMLMAVIGDKAMMLPVRAWGANKIE